MQRPAETVCCALAALWAKVVERRDALVSLRQERDFLSRIMETSPAGILRLDREGRIVFANARAEAILGRTREELLSLGYDSPDLGIANRDGQPLAAKERLFADMMARGRPVADVRVSVERPDGRRVELRISGAPLRDADGATAGFVFTLEDVTEGVRAEHELERLATFPEMNPSPVVEVGLDGAIRYANPEAVRRFPDLAEKGMDHALLAGVKANIQRFRGGDRQVLMLEIGIGDAFFAQAVHLVPHTDSVRVYSVDVTERHRAEEAVRESEARYRTLTRNFPNGAVILFDRELRYTLADGTGLAAAGLSKEKVEGRTLWEVSPPEASVLLEPRYREALAGSASVFEVTRQGRTHEIHVLPIRDDQGNVVAGMSVSQDITARKQAQEALEESRRFAQRIVDTDPLLVYIYDLAEQRNAYANREISATLGYTPEEVQEMGPLVMAQLVHPEDAAAVAEHHRKMADVQDGEIREIEYRMRHKSGEWCWLRSRDTLFLRGADGSARQILGSAEDITAQKKAEALVANYQKRLRSLTSRLVLSEERERRRIAVFLHDQIGQTLALARIRAQALKAVLPQASDVALVAEVRSLIDQAIQDTRSLTFDLSPPILYELGFAPALEWLLDGIQKQHGIRTAIEGDAATWPIAEDVRVVLFLAVREVLMNVVKHAGAQSVRVVTSAAGDSLTVRVTDDGAGFDAIAACAPGSPSAGFGLFNIRERLEHLGGRLDIESSPGQGTRVTLVAPLKKNNGPKRGVQG